MRRHLALGGLAAGAVIVAVAGCHDEPTGVARGSALPAGVVPGGSPTASLSGGASLGSYVAAPPATNARPTMGAMTPTSTGIATPAGLLFRVRATGAIDVEPNPAVLAGWGANAIGAGDMKMARPTGPAGNQYGFLKLKVSLQAGSLAGLDLAPVGGDSMQVERVVLAPNAGTLIAERTYIGGEISCYSPGRLECPPLLHTAESALEPFWKLQGQHVVEAELLAAELTLQADQRTVTPHRVVTFTAGSDPASVPAVQWIQYGIIASAAVPLHVTQWRWVPDSGTGQTVACTHTDRVCGANIEESGTMYVDALVNGEAKTQSTHVQVVNGTATLVLDADATAVAPGTLVTFSARAEPDTIDGQPVVLSDFQWSENGLTGAPIAAARLAPSAPASTRRAGQQFGSSAGAMSPNVCLDGGPINPCVLTVYASGTMTVTAKVNGSEQSGTASVSVDSVPCPTNDSLMLLDDPVVRSAMTTAWDSSHVDEDPARRVERKVFVYDSAGSIITHLAPVTENDTPCSSYAQDPAPAPSGQLIAIVHTHPFRLGDRLPPVCLPANAPPGSVAYYGKTYGGPSSSDWQQQAALHPVPFVILDRDNIYRSFPLDPQTDFEIVPVPYNPSEAHYQPKRNAWKAHVQQYKRREHGCTRA